MNKLSLTTQKALLIERIVKTDGMTSRTACASLSLPARDFSSLSCRAPLSPVDAKQDGFSVNRLGRKAERSVKDLVVDTDGTLDKNVGQARRKNGCALTYTADRASSNRTSSVHS